jgi:hypothetical protein
LLVAVEAVVIVVQFRKTTAVVVALVALEHPLEHLVVEHLPNLH